MKGALANTLLAASSLCLGLLVVDRVVVWAYPVTSIYRIDADADYRMRSNVSVPLVSPEYRTLVETNSRGMRGDEPGDQPCTILVLGDSIAFGYGVNDDETFPAQLARLMGDRFPGRFQVLNAGVSGYDTRREVAFLEREAGELRPDVVVVQFYINDVLSNSGDFYFRPISGGFLSQTPFAGLDAVYNYVAHYPYKLLFKLGLRPGYREAEHLACVADNGCEAGWAATRVQLERLALFTREHGILAVLFRVPSREEVAGDAGPEPAAENHAALTLRDAAEAVGLSFVDLAQDPGLLQDDYFTIDGHLTVSGNRRAASWLYQGALPILDSAAAACEP